jgi:hypothetical protein
MLFQICVFIEIVKLFEYKFFSNYSVLLFLHEFFIRIIVLIWDRHNLFKGEVYIQHLAVLKERHERRMACLLKLNN